jgi:UDP-N-acetylmuramoyl-tripeptide--D-alanyl-D-alanine ligase
MSYEMSLADLVAVTEGKLINSDNENTCHFSKISTDTRKVSKGDVFLALSGENFDGHQFCSQAVALGATGLIVEQEQALNIPQLIVGSCHLALGAIANYNRRKYLGPLIAVTGSNGKTTTKEIIAAILREKGPTLATLGNLNNEIGVPLTLLRFDGEQRFSVIEMGANAKGEISYCTHLAKPDVAIITNAMGAHLEGFGSLQGVVEAKGEIFQGLGSDGTAVLNLDDANVDQWLLLTQGKKQVTFSLENSSADVYASNLVQQKAGNFSFKLHFKGESKEVNLQLLAIHNVKNALAAAASVFAIGGTFSQIVKGLENSSAIDGRLKTAAGLHESIVIDDSYNGNPDSVKAGIDLLSQLSGKKILALGDMAELGENENELHASIGKYANTQGLDYVYSCGPKGRLAAEQFAIENDSQVMAFDNRQNMIDSLKNILCKNTKVLVKGSLSAGMKDVVNQLTLGSN